MAEDTARALGSGSSTTIKIGDKDCQIRPLTIAELGELERDCLSRYKRAYLKTYSENMDLLSDGAGTKLLNDKFEEVARWDIADLPPKSVYDPTQIKVTDKLVGWLKENVELLLDDEDEKGNKKKLSKERAKDRIRVLTALSLDNGELQDATYESLVGVAPKTAKVGYVNWWITATFDGMISMVYTCFRGNGLSRDDIVKAIGDNPTLLADASREIENLSAPAAGNG